MTDPRRHRLARRVEGPRITYACACANEVDRASGVLRRVEWCPKHQAMRRDPATLGEAYYRELGVIDAAGRLRATAHVAELEEALGPLPPATPPVDALEVGCGASPYVDAVRAAGYAYFGLDPAPWVRPWMARRWGAWCDTMRLEDVRAFHAYALVLCAHAFEHMDDAPAAIRHCARLLAPGGELWLVVPDDSDPVNPDHIYFFTPDTLRACLEAAGLAVERIVTRRHVPHENFLYARARKP
jgi:SAM-dependent methyltransferase